MHHASCIAAASGAPGGRTALSNTSGRKPKERMRISQRDKTLTVVCPPAWRADDVGDYSAIERIIEGGRIAELSLDLSRVEEINCATMWLIDQIQWKCVTSRVTFHLGETSKLATLFLNALGAFNK